MNALPVREALAAVLVVVSLASLTIAVARVVRARSGAVARLFGNLALPFGLVPLLVALALVGPSSGLGIAALILCFQVIAGTAENHIAGRLSWLRDGRDRTGENRHSGETHS